MTLPASLPTKYTALSIDVSEYIATVTLCRPELFNRFDDCLHIELANCMTELQSRSDVRAIVLASTGKVFSAGGDTDLMLECYESMEARLRITDNARRLLRAMVDLPQPLVVALHGDAIGLGATVALAGDAIVAARSAGLADPHVQFALVAGDGGCVFWPASAGSLVARRYLLTGDRMPAETALTLGMVTDLVDDPAEVLGAATGLAKRIAALPPLAVQGTKRALGSLMNARVNEVFNVSIAHEVWTLGSDDLREAVTAFRERRQPEFRGH